jgi:hypothetical protein
VCAIDDLGQQDAVLIRALHFLLFPTEDFANGLLARERFVSPAAGAPGAVVDADHLLVNE